MSASEGSAARGTRKTGQRRRAIGRSPPDYLSRGNSGIKRELRSARCRVSLLPPMARVGRF